jgi:hypothetical protein
MPFGTTPTHLQQASLANKLHAVCSAVVTYVVGLYYIRFHTISLLSQDLSRSGNSTRFLRPKYAVRRKDPGHASGLARVAFHSATDPIFVMLSGVAIHIAKLIPKALRTKMNMSLHQSHPTNDIISNVFTKTRSSSLIDVALCHAY